MRSFSWALTCLTLSCLMAACGGGSNPSDNTKISASCDSTALWAASPSPSGTAIPDNNPIGISVTWDNQTCSLQTVSSAVLEICLNHSAPAELIWTLTPPSSINALPLTPPANWNASSTVCGDAGPTQGKLQRVDVPQSALSYAANRGRWTLHVSDQTLGNAGTLIQWRVIAQGYK